MKFDRQVVEPGIFRGLLGVHHPHIHLEMVLSLRFFVKLFYHKPFTNVKNTKFV